jgi:hypothetical protein
MVTVAGDSPPRVAAAKQGSARNGRAHFTRYTSSGLWADRVRALFAWGEEEEDSQKKRGWHNAKFRVFTRALHDITKEEIGEEYTRLFLRELYIIAAFTLWAIPQYDYDKLSVMYKASKHHAKDVQADIRRLTPLERTNWLIPQIARKYGKQVKMMRQYHSLDEDNDGERISEQEYAELVREIGEAFNPKTLAVYGSESRGPGYIIYDPYLYGIKVRLVRADEFHRTLAEIEED